MKKIILPVILCFLSLGALQLKAQVTDAAISVSFDPYVVQDKPYSIPLKIINAGETVLENVVVSWSLDDQSPETQTFSWNPNLFKPNYYANVQHKFPVTITTPGIHTLKVWIGDVNGAADNNVENNVMTVKFKTVSVEIPKTVVLEKFTGAWCIHCPDANCELKDMMDKYENLVTIEVHNGDAMAIAAERQLSSRFKLTGFPSIAVDRRLFAGETAIALSRGVAFDYTEGLVQSVTPYNLEMTQSYNKDTREVTVTVKGTSSIDMDGDLFLNCVVTESNIPGVGTGYEQKIASTYTNNPNHCYYRQTSPMKDYYHQHVLRDYMGGIDGSKVTTGSVTKGMEYTKTFTYKLNSNWNLDNIHLVAYAYGSDASVEYTGIFTGNEAKLSIEPTSVSNKLNATNQVSVYPNPANESLTVTVTGVHQQMDITVLNALGQTVKTIPGNFNGNTADITIDTAEWLNGLYFVTVGNQVAKVIVNH